MGNNNDIRVVLGSLRYKSAPNTDISFKVPLEQNYKQNVEFDRISNINLQQVFDDERQASTIFRPACKFSVLFKNSYAGQTNYVPFENNMYYLNVDGAAAAQCALGANAVSWTGLPQYNEFDFIRTDYNVSGYTQPPNNHLLFNARSASTYNWNFYVSYPFQNDFTKNLQAIDKKTLQTLTWASGDGIPFVIEKTQNYGKNLISFRCPVKHGLKVNDHVQLNLSYNGTNIFKVDILGSNTFDSNQYVFNLIDIGYTGSTFNTGTVGTFKRVILQSNTADTISTYYVRKHKIITNPEDAVLVKAGFEENLFGTKKKYESSAYTPNNISRVSIKEGAQSYTLSFNKDINIRNRLDNLGRPLTEIFFTTIWSGYFGWTTGKLKQGYEFNLPLDPSTGLPNTYWENINSYSDSGIPTQNWTNSLGNTFSYVKPLKVDDIIDGDLCEWNEFEQKERVISKINHKFIFNPTYFSIFIPPTIANNPYGYYYQPHYKLKLRDYSDYIETAAPAGVVNIPSYAYFSSTLNQFLWRDIYTYGFIDGVSNLGVNYPFLNQAHYPFDNYIFRIVPEGTNYTEQTIIANPITDECE